MDQASRTARKHPEQVEAGIVKDGDAVKEAEVDRLIRRHLQQKSNGQEKGPHRFDHEGVEQDTADQPDNALHRAMVHGLL
ncbi:hypothetical protein D3C73_1352010 [compost metagenome]